MFKDISYLELWWLFCSVEQNHLCNFSRGHHEEQFCEIVLNYDEWFRRCCSKDFLSRALIAGMFSGPNPLCNFGRGHYGEHSCETVLNLNQWFRRCHLKKTFTDNGCMMDEDRSL